MLQQYIVGWFVGTVFAVLSAVAIAARIQLTGARKDREEAIKLASQAMDAKQAAEEGFSKAKQFFDERMKIPVTVGMTEEQIDILSNRLGAKLFDIGRMPSGTPS